ncbi:unnamed protein product [Scytosiphon promiscuus]
MIDTSKLSLGWSKLGVSKQTPMGATHHQAVPIYFKLVCKAVVEDEEGAFFLKATMVQTVRLKDVQPLIAERPPSYNESSATEKEDFMFNIVLQNTLQGGEISLRRVVTMHGPRGESWSQVFDLFVPLDVRSMWQRFPFQIFQASVELDLQPKLKRGGRDGEPLRDQLIADGSPRVTIKNRNDFDRSRTLALLQEKPTVKIAAGARREAEARESRWPEKQSFNSDHLQITFWLHEHPTEVFFNVLGPLLLVTILVWVNFNEFYGITNIGADCQATERDPGYLANGIGIALTAVVMLPQIQTKKRGSNRRTSSFYGRDGLAVVILVGLGVSTLQSCTAAFIGCLICSLAIVTLVGAFVAHHLKWKKIRQKVELAHLLRADRQSLYEEDNLSDDDRDSLSFGKALRYGTTQPIKRQRKWFGSQRVKSASIVETSRQKKVTDQRSPPARPVWESSKAEKEIEKNDEDDADVESDVGPEDAEIAEADEWEVLTKNLQAGESYSSQDGGVRLNVPPGSLRGPGPGPVRLHFSSQTVTCQGEHYFTHTIVHCPPHHRFTEPLLLEFFLDDPAVSDGKASVKEVLERYQVLRMSHGDDKWQPLEPKDISLVEDLDATYLRAEIHHFTWFSCCMKCDPSSGITYFDQKKTDKVVVHNDSDQRLLLVMLPTQYVAARDKSHKVQISVGGSLPGGGGLEVGGGLERQTRTEYVWLPRGESPSSQVVLPRAKQQELRLRSNGCPEHLLICAERLVGELSTTQATPSSPSSPGQMAPAATVRTKAYRVVKFYDAPIVGGGDGLIIHQCRVDQDPQDECSVRAKGVDLKHVAMVLAGMGEGDREKEQGAEEKKGGDGTKPSSKTWLSRLGGR